jgi:hypothetical protein
MHLERIALKTSKGTSKRGVLGISVGLKNINCEDDHSDIDLDLQRGRVKYEIRNLLRGTTG